MIAGRMRSASEATVPLNVRPMRGKARWSGEAVLDTGFDGDICLPATIVQDLGLEFAGVIDIVLGDGRRAPVSLYRARVKWCEDDRAVAVVETLRRRLLAWACCKITT